MKKRVSGTEPKGDFNSRFITVKPGHGIVGGQYELVGVQKVGDRFEDLIKNSAGDTKWVGHKDIMGLVVRTNTV